MNEYGYFINDGYIVTERKTPRHWYNYLYNDEYITFTSQVGFGQGFAQDNMGRRMKVVTDRAVYISDGTEFWQANGLPVHQQFDQFECLHSVGYSLISAQKNQIKTECMLFVPRNGRREIMKVTIKNLSDRSRTIKVIPYIATEIDGEYKPQGYETSIARFSKDKQAVYATSYVKFDFPDRGMQKKTCAYLCSNMKVSGFDTRRNAFLGVYGNKLVPEALIEDGGCRNTECIAEKICFALENTVTLASNEETSIYYTVGAEPDVESIPQFTADEIEEQLQQTIRYHKNVCEGVKIQTPWNDLNRLFNDWLKYQTNMGSRWARVRHNGFRDMCSDTECLSCFAGALAAQRLERILTYQYENGFAPRTFLNGSIQDKNFADNTVWLTYTTYAVVKELGDVSYLQKIVPFNNGVSATVYQHIKQSVEFLWNFTGHYGLVRIWGGDWNDGLNSAGLKGDGVSVWLSIAFVRAAKMLSEMAMWLDKEDDAAQFVKYAAEMEKRIESYGWDEDRYIYAITDEKILVGARESEEGSMTALPQLWSVLAGLNQEHSEIAMNTLERELNTDLGVLVSKPPYTMKSDYLGSVTRKPAGLHENGGVYLHASVWKLAVDSMLHRNDKVEEGLMKILPGNHTYFPTCGEPYVMFNSYLGTETEYRAGKPGQSWRTASGQWLLYSIVRFVFGLKPELDGMVLCPCLPTSWRDTSITKIFRGTEYNIHYIQKAEGACNTIESITVNGKEHCISKPIAPTEKVLNIEVILTKKG